MYEIRKQFNFEYGHRVWNQELDKDLAGTNKCKCRGLHGHSGVLTVQLASRMLENGMVTDFAHLNWFKDFLDTYFDHTMVLDVRDPMLRVLMIYKMAIYVKWDVLYFGTQHCLKQINLDDLRREVANLKEGDEINAYETTAIYEFFDHVTLVNFVPTAENLSRFFYAVVNEKLPGMVQSVTLQETAKCSATYRGAI